MTVPPFIHDRPAVHPHPHAVCPSESYNPHWSDVVHYSHTVCTSTANPIRHLCLQSQAHMVMSHPYVALSSTLYPLTSRPALPAGEPDAEWRYDQSQAAQGSARSTGEGATEEVPAHQVHEEHLLAMCR